MGHYAKDGLYPLYCVNLLCHSLTTRDQSSISPDKDTEMITDD